MKHVQRLPFKREVHVLTWVEWISFAQIVMLCIERQKD
jgi:hypothetical protein